MRRAPELCGVPTSTWRQEQREHEGCGAFPGATRILDNLVWCRTGPTTSRMWNGDSSHSTLAVALFRRSRESLVRDRGPGGGLPGRRWQGADEQ